MKNEKNIVFFEPEFLARYLSGEVEPVEKSSVDAWLSQSAENREELERVRKMLESVDAFYKAKSFNSVKAFEKVKGKIKQQSVLSTRNNIRKLFIAKYYKYAAIILIAVMLGISAYYLGFRNNGAEYYSEIVSVDKQIISQFTLPDGSVVALNSNSKLIFPKEFIGDTREVTIVGEGFFEVKPDASKPFIINAGNAQVKVVGTSFNVSAYPGSESVEVVVATGKVQVTGITTGSEPFAGKVLLVPGEKGTLFSKTNLLEKTENKNLNYLSWKTHDFIFNDLPLGEVIECLEKTYNVRIAVSQPELNDLKFNAHFEKKSVDFILDVIRLTFNLELTEQNDQFTFSGRINS